jgi:hypothetical protein
MILILLVMLSLGLVAVNEFYISHVSVEDTQFGRIETRKTFGFTKEMSLFERRESFPFLLICRRDFSLFSAVLDVVFCTERSASDAEWSVFRDTEPDGAWDYRIDFSGSIYLVNQREGCPFFTYYEKGADGSWMEMVPPNGERTFSDVVFCWE